MSEEGAGTYCVECLEGIVDPIHLGTRVSGPVHGARTPRITAIRSCQSDLRIGFPVPIPAQSPAVPSSSLEPRGRYNGWLKVSENRERMNGVTYFVVFFQVLVKSRDWGQENDCIGVVEEWHPSMSLAPRTPGVMSDESAVSRHRVAPRASRAPMTSRASTGTRISGYTRPGVTT